MPTPDSPPRRIPRWLRWAGGIAAALFATFVAWVALVVYPDYVERARNPKVPEKVLQSLRDQYQPKNVTFSSSSCQGPAGPDLRPGVTRSGWRPDGAFEVDARVEVYCGFPIPVGSYKIEGAKLRLEYLVHMGNAVPPSCYCPHDVKYAIAGLEKRDYEIELVELRR